MTATDTPLPKRYVVVNLGQSNATPVGDAKGFEDLNFATCPRNPRFGANARTYTQGEARDEIVLPDPEFGPFQRVNYRGVANMNVRYLTFFNPASTYSERADVSPEVGGVTAVNYPGEFRVAIINSAREFVTVQKWQVVGSFPVVRKRTGVTHTASVATTRVVTIDGDVYPPLEVGEEFTYTLTSAQNSPDASTVYFYNQVGGYHDPGSMFEAANAGGIRPTTSITTQVTPTVVNRLVTAWALTIVSNGSDPAEFRCNESPVYVGRRVRIALRGTANTQDFPSGIDGATDYFVTRKATPNDASPASHYTFFLSTAPGGDEIALASLVAPLAPSTFTPANVNTGTGELTISGHGLSVNDRVQFSSSGALPAGLVAGVVYYVVGVAGSVVQVSLSQGGAVVVPANAGTGTHTITPVVGYTISLMPDGRDSTLAGMNLRCLTGTNAGEVRPLGPCSRIGVLWAATVTEPFSLTPQAGDTFAIEPPDVNGSVVPFDQWAYFLPLCVFNGREQGLPISYLCTIGTTTDPAKFQMEPGADLYDGAPVRFYRRQFADFAGTPATLADWPTSGLLEGRTYYVQNYDRATRLFEVSATYGGPSVVLTGNPGNHWVSLAETWLDKHNPAPPGFNYKNNDAVPRSFQAFRGPTVAPTPVQPGVAYHEGLAQRLAEVIGEPIYVIDLSVGATTLAEGSVPTVPPGDGIGWFDPATHRHWAPGPAGLWDRFKAHVAAAKIAAEREGVALEVLAVVFPQGESDSGETDRAARYYDNVVGFKARVRGHLKAEGLWPREASSLPFLQPAIRLPTLPGDWTKIQTVIDAIHRAADEDPFSRSWSTNDYAVNTVDNVHYIGATMNTMAQTAAAQIIDLRRVEDIELRVCNLALAIAGERAQLTSVFPPDGSEESVMCAQFYPEARDRVLEAHVWDFAARQTVLTAAEESHRGDWRYAYELPGNFAGVIGLGSDSYNAYEKREDVPEFSIEMNAAAQRRLYTNAPPSLPLRYKLRVVDPARFSSTCVQAIATLMASMIVRRTLKGEEGIRSGDALEQRAFALFRTAAANDANQMRDRPQATRLDWRR